MGFNYVNDTVLGLVPVFIILQYGIEGILLLGR